MIAFLARLFGRAKPRFFEADPRQAEAIAGLHAQSFHRGWSEEEVLSLLRDPAVTAHAAAIAGRVSGFILSRKAADEAEILSVAVDRRQRRCGLGRGLLDLHLRRLVATGIRTVFLEVGEGNTPALRLYRRAGFRQVGQRPNYYPQPGERPVTALVLRRDLA
jgi:[ribosomal protein S18]-alanine N-acetyltransferase